MEIDVHKMIEFKQNGDDRGKLVVVEGMKDIPFDIIFLFFYYHMLHDFQEVFLSSGV